MTGPDRTRGAESGDSAEQPARTPAPPSSTAPGTAEALALLAHDINNPLAIVLANLEFLHARLTSAADAPEALALQEIFRETRHAAERIRGVVQRIAVTATSPLASRDARVPRVGRTRDVRIRILIVDDEELLGRGLARSLRDYDVLVLASAVEALERVKAGETFDIILCDVMMPVMTGYDFYERVAVVAPELVERIVFMTGGATKPAREFLSKLPNRVLEKPFDLQSLRTMIRDRLSAASE